MYYVLLKSNEGMNAHKVFFIGPWGRVSTNQSINQNNNLFSTGTHKYVQRNFNNEGQKFDWEQGVHHPAAN